jgi:hypothetical protein
LVWSYDATVVDPKGMDLPDLKAARESAIRFCGEMLNHRNAVRGAAQEEAGRQADRATRATLAKKVY